MGFFQEALTLIDSYVAAYGAGILFAVMYLEALGGPLPAESALVATGVLAARGDLSIVHAFLAAWVGSVLGDSTGYAIGRFGGRVLLQRYGRFVKLTPERLASLETLFREKGFLIVMVARFVVVLRQLNGLVAGSVAMPWPRFLLANTIGAGLWTFLWSFGSYYFADLLAAPRH